MQPSRETSPKELVLSEERCRALTVEFARLKARLEQETVYLRDEINTELLFKKLIGDSPAMRQLTHRQVLEKCLRFRRPQLARVLSWVVRRHRLCQCPSPAGE